MKTRATVLASVLTVLILQAPSALAQGIGSSDASMEQSFSNFDASLDNTATQMSESTTQAENAASSRYLTNAQANQDTENEAERYFQDGQEQMIAGGGAYNSQGFMFGGGLGGFGGGGFGGGGMLGGNLSNLAAPNWNGSPSIRAPRYGSHNSVLSNYYGNVRPRRSYSIAE